MNTTKKMLNQCLILLTIALASALLSGCAPEVGSLEWCEDMEAKSKGDWTANEVTDYAKHCIIPKSED